MDKFLETHNLPRLNHEELVNLNRPLTRKKTESGIKNLPTMKSPELDGFTIKHKRMNTNPSQTLPKTEEDETTHSMRPATPWHQVLAWKAENNTHGWAPVLELLYNSAGLGWGQESAVQTSSRVMPMSRGQHWTSNCSVKLRTALGPVSLWGDLTGPSTHMPPGSQLSPQGPQTTQQELCLVTPWHLVGHPGSASILTGAL